MNGIETANKPLTATDLATEPDFQLGSVWCRPSLLTVSAGDQSETLEPRIMLVLVVLARHTGEVMTRDRLVELCWSGRVVSDDAIQRCINRLRKVSESLGGFELETIRRVGYRLTEAAPAADAPLSPVQAEPARSFAIFPWRPTLPLLAVVSMTAAIFFALPRLRSPEAPGLSTAVLAEIADLIDNDQYGNAFLLAYPSMQNAATRTAELETLWSRIVLPMRPLVEEDGATLWFKPYADRDGPWIEAGVTPLTASVDAPRGALRIKIEKPGFRTGYFVIANPGPSVLIDLPVSTPIPAFRRPEETIALPLGTAGALLDDDLVPVPHTNVPVSVRGWTRLPIGENRQDIPAFAIERTEVTNRQFKEFIDKGGYQNPAYWEGLEFRENGQLLSWEEAKTRFVDSTNRPGPAAWQLSSYPNGEAALPVGGISWYEAVAYARFRGRMLPTIHHWTRAAYTPYDPQYNTRPDIALQSRFLSPGPVPADTDAGLGPWGTVNMAGNVLEWVWNAAGDNVVIMGGAWRDDAFAFSMVMTAPPMRRVPHIGLRLMQAATPVHDALLQPVTLWQETPTIERIPVSDETFAGMRLQFTTSDADVVEQSVEVLQETELWIAEEILLRYDDGSAANLVLVRPLQYVAPLQPIVFAPGAGCCIAKRPNREALQRMAELEFVVKSGRALVLPIWAGSYERYTRALPEVGNEGAQDFERELALQFHEDIVRVIDYLETRPDMNAGRVGYMGTSLGAMSIAAVALTTEERIRAAVLLSGAISLRENIHPMYDMINYAPHITVPVLMLNGRFDPAGPYAPSQIRMFELLGTPAEHKAHQVFDAGHLDLPANTVAREASNWFDKYLGEVERGAPLVSK